MKRTKATGKILLVDDMIENLSLLSDLLTNNGYSVSSSIDGATALKYLEKNSPDIILLDIKMPEMDGFELCRQIKANQTTRHIPIIFISALSEVNDKVKAFAVGGVDYVTKPFQVEEVLARVDTHMTIQKIQRQLKQEVTVRKEAQQNLQVAYDEVEKTVKVRTRELEELKDRLEEENIYLQEEIKTTLNFDEIIGNSKAIKKALGLARQVAPSGTTVLILGETGTGKELIARVVYNLSPRKNRPLIKVNCAAIPFNLIESELFGHEKGAFTGAINQKIGRFELADKGTIFLDEIGDLPVELQSKLLRVLQEGEFERLGSSVTRKIDTRVLAATNRDLEKLRSERKFRDDLFFRLNVFPIHSPTLRDRKNDIPMLVKHFVDKFNQKIGKEIKIIPQKLLAALKTYHWPGNIRDLENIIERAVILSPGKQLQLGDWLTENRTADSQSAILTMNDLQREHIIHVLKLVNGRVRGDSGAAKLLGMEPTTLQSRMKKLGIKVEKNIAEMPP